ERRMGFSLHAARRGTPLGGVLSRQARQGSGTAFVPRPRRPARRRLRRWASSASCSASGCSCGSRFAAGAFFSWPRQAALLAAAAAGEPLLAHWTHTFIGSASPFLAQFFPLFLLAALFGKLMEDRGSASAIAAFLTERLGPRRAVLAVVLA